MRKTTNKGRWSTLAIIGLICVAVLAVGAIFFLKSGVGVKPNAGTSPPASLDAGVPVSTAASLPPAAQSTGRVNGPEGVSVLSWQISELKEHGRFSKVIEATVRNDSASAKRAVRVTFHLYAADGTKSTVSTTVHVMGVKPGMVSTSKHLIFDSEVVTAQLVSIEID